MYKFQVNFTAKKILKTFFLFMNVTQFVGKNFKKHMKVYISMFHLHKVLKQVQLIVKIAAVITKMGQGAMKRVERRL